MGLPQFGHDQINSAAYRYQSSAMGATVQQLAFRSHQIFVSLLHRHRADQLQIPKLRQAPGVGRNFLNFTFYD